MALTDIKTEKETLYKVSLSKSNCFVFSTRTQQTTIKKRVEEMKYIL